MKQWLPRAWYGNAAWPGLLHPLSLLYGCVSSRRRRAYQQGRKAVYRAGVPVVVVGNLTVGGTGKTPLTLALCLHLQNQGWRPALVSRGYGGRSTAYPLLVTVDTPAASSGDEALLLTRNISAPVVVDPERSRGVRYLEATQHPDVILCDDGLQHYALARDIEIAVVDGRRGFGNGRLLPAGPLREPLQRLGEVDFVVVNGDTLHLPATVRHCTNMQLLPECLVNLVTGETSSCAQWQQRHGDAPVHAVAGIGNPARFFGTLQEAGFAIIAHPFPDHHRYEGHDISFGDSHAVIMTEKDAVKCTALATERHWYLKVRAQLQESFLQEFTRQLTLLRPPGPDVPCG